MLYMLILYIIYDLFYIKRIISDFFGNKSNNFYNSQFSLSLSLSLFLLWVKSALKKNISQNRITHKSLSKFFSLTPLSSVQLFNWWTLTCKLFCLIQVLLWNEWRAAAPAPEPNMNKLNMKWIKGPNNRFLSLSLSIYLYILPLSLFFTQAHKQTRTLTPPYICILGNTREKDL